MSMIKRTPRDKPNTTPSAKPTSLVAVDRQEELQTKKIRVYADDMLIHQKPDLYYVLEEKLAVV